MSGHPTAQRRSAALAKFSFLEPKGFSTAARTAAHMARTRFIQGTVLEQTFPWLT